MAASSTKRVPKAHSRNPYVVLGIDRHASEEAVQQAWMKLRDIHVDPVKTAKLDTARFQITAERKTAAEQQASATVADSASATTRIISEHSVDEGSTPPVAAIPGPDAVRSRVVPTDLEQPPPGLGFTPVGPSISFEDFVHEMRALEKEASGGRLAQLQADRRTGMLYLCGQHHYAGSNLTLDQWCRQHLVMPYARIAECVFLVEPWLDIKAAHIWYESEGYLQGWRVTRGRGAPYGKNVLQLHRDFLAGKHPGEREAAAEAKRDEKRQASLAKDACLVDPLDNVPPVRRSDDFEQQVVELEEARVSMRQDFEAAAAAARHHRKRARMMLQQVRRHRVRTLAAEARANLAEARLREAGFNVM
jgi:hypothetical protein